jgi:hypothetical protein
MTTPTALSGWAPPQYDPAARYDHISHDCPWCERRQVFFRDAGSRAPFRCRTCFYGLRRRPYAAPAARSVRVQTDIDDPLELLRALCAHLG